MFADYIGDGNIKMFGKGEVALVAAGDGHDGARAITCQYVFRDPDGYLPSIKWIDRICSREAAGNLFYFGQAFPVAAAFYIA